VYAICQGFLLVKEKGISDLACYFDSLLCVRIITDLSMKLDAYVVLIQDKLMEQINATINHTRHEGDNCADFMAKFGASLNI
jgi:hypothetical protein